MGQQWSKVQWLNEGNHNTPIFYQMVHKRENNVKSTINQGKEWSIRQKFQLFPLKFQVAEDTG